MGARLTLDVDHPQAGVTLPDEARACLGLWAEVLRVAVEDARDSGCMPSGVRPDDKLRVRMLLRDHAKAWLTSDEDGTGTFLWICGLLELEPSAVRAALAHRLEAPPP